MKNSDSSAFAGPWPKGVNTRVRDFEVDDKALRNAVNVNITSGGGIVSRTGFGIESAADYHSLWGDGGAYGLCVKNGALTRLDVSKDGSVTETTLRAGMQEGRAVSYVRVNDAIYYSNGVITGKVVNGLSEPWGIEHANPPKAAPLAYGGMDEGFYQVAITYVSASGEEGGTSRAVSVTVPAGGGIALSEIPQPVGGNVSKVRIYMTSAGGHTFYERTEIPTGLTTKDLSASSLMGAELSTWGLYPPPPGDVLALHGASILIAKGPYLWFTEPFYYGQHKTMNVYQFRGDISLVASLNKSMLAVAADVHYLLAGPDASSFDMGESFQYRAIKGTLVTLPENRKFWATEKGWIKYEPAAGISEVLADRVVIETATQGASLYREEGGEKFIITTLIDGAASTSAAQDFIDAEIIRRS